MGARSLDQALADALAAVRAAWPALALDDGAFVEHLRRHLRGGSEAAAVAALHAGDLFLACACAAGEPAALAALEERLGELPALLAAVRPSATELDEVRQLLRERLLLGERPRIAEYSGRGALRGWLRVAAIRTLANLRRGEQPRRRAEAAATLQAVLVDPELDHIKQRYAGEFERALADAFAALSAHERNLLRLQLLDGLDLDKIGDLHRVHRATAARWLVEARRHVLAETQRLLRERLRISPEELASLYTVVKSQLDLSLSGLFRR